MEVILKDDLKGLGYKFDIVKVRDGYARNWLIPKGLAIVANESNRKVRDENLRQAGRKLQKFLDDAQAIANKLTDLTVTIRMRVGENGRIFGAVTNVQIAEALKEKGVEIDRRRITTKEDIKTVGVFTAEADLHRDVKAVFNVEVVAE